MNSASPSKRRALAPLDANTRSPVAVSRSSPSKMNVSKAKLSLGTSPIEPDAIKRPMELDSNRDIPTATKRRRLSGTGSEQLSPQNVKPILKESEDIPSRRSASPESSSLFDNSMIDNSHVTAITEPEVEPINPIAIEARPRQRSMTREEARQKTEILRLRLGLASYKVRTNQADVPLERLQVRPLPSRFLRPSLSNVSLPPPIARLPPQIVDARTDGETSKASSDPERSEEGTYDRKLLPPASSQKTIEPNSSFSSLASTESNPSFAGDLDKGPEAEPTLPSPSVNTPERQRQQHLVVGELEDGGRDGAAEGLLSLSQSSPASGLK